MFRFTPQSSMRSAITHSQNVAARLSVLQTQASSGLKYSRASDNPIDTRSIGRIKRSIAYLQTQQEDIGKATAHLNTSVSQLLEANNLLTRAKQIGLQAPQSLGQGELDTLAAEIDSIINRFLSISNYQNDGRYLFSGDAFSTVPFQIHDEPGLAIPQVEYSGSLQSVETVISLSVSVKTTYAGNEVFQAPNRSDTLFLGQTGAASGTGTDSHVGRANLIVQHTLTNYAAGSGIAPGTSSADSDTIIGPPGAHTLTIVDTSGTGTSGTVSLNGGSPVPWTSSETDLEVTGPSGEVVYVDTSSITAGFSGDISIEATGTLSTDGGRSETAIDFTGNQLIYNDVTSEVLNVDSTNIRRTGTDHIEFPGTSDALTVLLELKDDLLNTRGLSDSQKSKSFERRVADLERFSDHLLNVVGEMSVSLQDLEQLSFQNDQNQLDLRTRLGELESADLSAVVIELQSLQTALQFNYASFAIVQSNNLLDYLG